MSQYCLLCERWVEPKRKKGIVVWGIAGTLILFFFIDWIYTPYTDGHDFFIMSLGSFGIMFIIFFFALVIYSVSPKVCPICGSKTMKEILSSHQTKKCPYCGREMDMDWEICPYCGKKYAEENLKLMCHYCGRKLEKDWDVCPYCGKEINGRDMFKNELSIGR